MDCCSSGIHLSQQNKDHLPTNELNMSCGHLAYIGKAYHVLGAKQEHRKSAVFNNL